MPSSLSDSLVGCLLGTAVGDAVGLACEGYSKARQQRVFGPIEGPRFVFGRGMVSDDTEHSCLIAQAFIASVGEEADFEKALAGEMKRWFLAAPAGLGAATLKACTRLCAGVAPSESGVFSAGNGPAMRAALLGLACRDINHLRALNRISSRITHTDPKAEWGALAVALAARHFANEVPIDASKYFDALGAVPPEASEFLNAVEAALQSVQRGQSSEEFAAVIGLGHGVSGYVLHTVPVALHAAFRQPDDLRSAVLNVVRCGGDTDSTAAIVGAIIGARVGKSGVPRDWLDALCEWPRNVDWMEQLATRLSEVVSTQTPQKPLQVPPGASALRNALFWMIVWPHVLRRLLPPY